MRYLERWEQARPDSGDTCAALWTYKNHRTVCLKQVNFTACKLYVNKAVREEKDSALPASTPGGSQFTEKAKERAKQKGKTKRGAQRGPPFP